MKGLVLLLIIASIISFGLVAAILSGETPEEPPKISKFNIFTSAVCESNGDFVHCKDEIFVNCSGKITKADDVAECHGIEIDLPSTTGFAVFGNDWEDPRN
ncbi:hypothetical protein HYX08_03355 [Candidatus Woesearchaeota archaeon]|nr:hypothetical protein [Candidatus Woesearchaeota archaeon]